MYYIVYVLVLLCAAPCRSVPLRAAHAALCCYVLPYGVLHAPQVPGRSGEPGFLPRSPSCSGKDRVAAAVARASAWSDAPPPAQSNPVNLPCWIRLGLVVISRPKPRLIQGKITDLTAGGHAEVGAPTLRVVRRRDPFMPLAWTNTCLTPLNRLRLHRDRLSYTTDSSRGSCTSMAPRT
eukprot:gene7627-biopygen16569